MEETGKVCKKGYRRVRKKGEEKREEGTHDVRGPLPSVSSIIETGGL